MRFARAASPVLNPARDERGHASENFEDSRKLHPAFATLQQEDMVTQALSAPLHAGAEKYYQEAGMM